MNYYDELGLAPSAADEDIRRAHRTLSKLLHPDRQTEPEAREAAELQMRRINQIVDTLLDPQRRRQYDASLRTGPLPVAVVRQERRRIRRGWHFGDPVSLVLTVVAALLLTGGAIWLLEGDLIRFDTAESHPAALLPHGPQTTGPQTPGPHKSAGKGPVSPSAPVNDTPVETVAAGKPHHQVEVSVPAVRPSQSSSQPVVEPPSEQVTVRPVTPAAQNILAAPPPQPAATMPVVTHGESTPAASKPAPTLAGLWLYAPPENQKAGVKVVLYAPEYIQLQIRAADNGQVQGDYSARYMVSDRPISGNVEFRFVGKAEGARTYAWQADDGSLGVVDLKMLAADSLQVSWRVGHFGRHLGLGAGTAVLIRKIDR